MSHSYSIEFESSGDEDESRLPPTKESILQSPNWKPKPGLGLTSQDTPQVECSIEIMNYTGLTLLAPNIHLNMGQVYGDAKPADFIEPQTRDAFTWLQMTHGDAVLNTAITGTCGTASWFISGKDRRLVIMWSVPRLPLYNNWLAVGFTKVGKIRDTSQNNSWFDEMYGRYQGMQPSGELDFIRKDFERSSHYRQNVEEYKYQIKNMVCRKSRGLEIRGTMAGRGKVEVQIKLFQTGQ